MLHLLFAYFKQIDGQIAFILWALYMQLPLQIANYFRSLQPAQHIRYSAAAGGRTALPAQWQVEDHEGDVGGEREGYHTEGIVEPPCEEFKCQQI